MIFDHKLLKLAKEYERRCVFAQQKPIRPGAPGSPGYTQPIKDTVIYDKSNITKKDPRFDTGGFQQHDEMIDEEDTSEKEKQLTEPSEKSKEILYKV